MTPDLVDRIYECSFLPEKWPETLEAIAEGAGAVGASMSIAVRAGPGRYTIGREDADHATSSDGVRAIVAAMSDPRFDATEFFRPLAARGQFGFTGDQEIFSPEDYLRIPLFRDLLAPLGLKWGAGTFFVPPVGATIVFGLRRRTEKGPFDSEALDFLNQLRPHIGRAAVVAARLGLERAKAAAQTLAALGLPALVFDGDGGVVAANALIQALPEIVHWLARDRFALHDSAADAQWRVALTSTASERAAVIRSFPIRRSTGAAAMVAHLVPIRRDARDLFDRSAAMLVLTPVAAPQAPSAGLVQSLFDLTPREASVAIGLAAGKTVDDLAEEGELSTTTVRSHVRGVLEKTNSRRQADAALLFAGLSLARQEHNA